MPEQTSINWSIDDKRFSVHVHHPHFEDRDVMVVKDREGNAPPFASIDFIDREHPLHPSIYVIAHEEQLEAMIAELNKALQEIKASKK